MVPLSRNLARWRAHSRPVIQCHKPSQTFRRRSLTTLAIETSCDDTAVAILTRNHNGSAEKEGPAYSLLFNESVSSDHREFRGIEPIVAVMGHTTSLAPLLRKAIAHLPDATDLETASSKGRKGRSKICWTEDGRPKKVPDFVSVTRGPGNMSNLSVGLNTAKGLAVAWDVPLVGVHHMQAHALTPRFVNALEMGTAADKGPRTKKDGVARTVTPGFPFLSLLVSGGHTQLVYSKSLTDHKIIANTLDVAVGNFLDHAARNILPPEILAAVPDVKYGRHLETFAFPDGGTPEEYAFCPFSRYREVGGLPSGYNWMIPSPFPTNRRLAFTFSGVGSVATQVAADINAAASYRAASDIMDERRTLARHTLATAFRHLADRLCIALMDSPELAQRPTRLVVAGGVACNRFLMHILRESLAARGFRRIQIIVPPPSFCTDNAAMIAWTGMEMYTNGWHSDMSILAINKWLMDPEQGEGILGAPGWLKR